MLTESAQCTFGPCDTAYVACVKHFCLSGAKQTSPFSQTCPQTCPELRIVSKMGVSACNIITPDGNMERSSASCLRADQSIVTVAEVEEGPSQKEKREQRQQERQEQGRKQQNAEAEAKLQKLKQKQQEKEERRKSLVGAVPPPRAALAHLADAEAMPLFPEAEVSCAVVCNFSIDDTDAGHAYAHSQAVYVDSMHKKQGLEPCVWSSCHALLLCLLPEHSEVTDLLAGTQLLVH